MSSGSGRTKEWVLEHSADEARALDPLMGWTSSRDTQTQVRLHFDSKAEALEYAARRGIVAVVSDPHERKQIIRPGGYGDNFATNRRSVWTH
jgi:NADH dehydrogenase